MSRRLDGASAEQLSALATSLRADLEDLEFFEETIIDLVGAEAYAAREQGIFAPARSALAAKQRVDEPPTASRPRLMNAIRLLLLGEPVPSDVVDAVFPNTGSAALLAAAVLNEDRDAGEGAVRAAVSLNPVSLRDPSGSIDPWWVLSDLDDHLRSAPARSEHVMGVGGATRSLIAQIPDTPRDRVLDLGTGCGIVALYCARHVSAQVTATDISERALAFTRANAALNDVESRIDVRSGSLFEPVRDDTFDLIVSNPPFVITPRRSDVPVYEYRDAGLVGDALARLVIEGAPRHLTEDGLFLCLANWEAAWGQNGRDAVAGWIENAATEAGSAVEAWVIERERLTPIGYARLWARDGGTQPGAAGFDELVGAWIDDFAERRVVAVGMGSVRIRRRGGIPADSQIRAEERGGAYGADRLGAVLDTVFEHGSAVDRFSDDEVRRTRWVRSDAVTELRTHTPGVEAPSALELSVEEPIEQRVHSDTLLSAAIGACDGELSLEQIASALAQLLEVDAEAVVESLVHSARELVWLGMLSPSPR